MNSVRRVNLSSGIIGMLLTSPKRALEQCLRQLSEEGEEVVFVIGDQFNFVQNIINFIILLLTFFLWCPAPGYLVIARPLRKGATVAPREDRAFGGESSGNVPPATTNCPKCGRSYAGDLRGQFCESCGAQL